jgi:hypothetical protein
VQTRADEPEEATTSQKTVVLALGAVLAVILIFAGLGVGGVALIARSMKGSDAYRHSLSFLRNAAQIQTDLGLPIEDGFLPSGRIATSGATGSADLTISLSGPRGDGRAHVVLERGVGGWSVTKAEWASAGRVTTLVERPSAP